MDPFKQQEVDKVVIFFHGWFIVNLDYIWCEPPHKKKKGERFGLTAAFLVTVVEAVVCAVAAGPLRNTAVVCLAGELCVFITLVVWTHWGETEIDERWDLRRRVRTNVQKLQNDNKEIKSRQSTETPCSSKTHCKLRTAHPTRLHNRPGRHTRSLKADSGHWRTWTLPVGRSSGHKTLHPRRCHLSSPLLHRSARTQGCTSCFYTGTGWPHTDDHLTRNTHHELSSADNLTILKACKQISNFRMQIKNHLRLNVFF